MVRLNVSRSTLTNVENGLQTPRMPLILGVPDALAVEPANFFGYIGLKVVNASTSGAAGCRASAEQALEHAQTAPIAQRSPSLAR